MATPIIHVSNFTPDGKLRRLHPKRPPRPRTRTGRGHPTTSEIGPCYTDPERAFMCALDHWKQVHHNYLPGWDVVLRVAGELGYTRAAPPDVPEFAAAMRRFGREHGRRFPTCSEALEVLLSLDYRLPAG